jgi:hypothetical protein
MSISSASNSSATIQDDTTSHTLSPSSPTPTPSPAFLHIDSSPSPPSSSESSPSQDEFGDLFDIDCDVAIPGTEDLLFGDEEFAETHELWTADPEDFEDVNMSADTLDRILHRAEARLKEQEAFAERISLQKAPSEIKDVSRSRPNLPAPYMDSTKRVIRVDGKDLVSKEMRDLANRSRVVEDPVSIQRKKIKNKRKSFRDLLHIPRNDENNPILLFSKRIIVPYWVQPATMRVLNHSYSDRPLISHFV